MAYCKRILNVSIFVYIQKKKKTCFGQILNVSWGPKDSFQRVYKAPSREPEVIPLLWGFMPNSRGPTGPLSPPQEIERKAWSALNF